MAKSSALSAGPTSSARSRRQRARHRARARMTTAQIRARLVAELSREEWAKVWPEDIIVRDGVVHFWLSSDEPEENKQALRVAAETTSGIRRVEEHVVPAPVFPAF